MTPHSKLRKRCQAISNSTFALLGSVVLLTFLLVSSASFLPPSASASTLHAAASMQQASPQPLSGDGDGCEPGRTTETGVNWFSGSDLDNGSIGTPLGGVEAEIYEYSPWVDSADTAGMSMWAMLWNRTYGDYAQIGWLEQPGGNRHVFYQEFTAGGYRPGNTFPADPINSWSYFKVLFNPTTEYGGNYSFYDNGKDWWDSFYDWWPNDSQIEAEQQDQATQMPGTPHNTGQVGSAEYYAPAGAGTWQQFFGPMYDQKGYMKSSPGAGVGEIGGWTLWDGAAACQGI